MTTPDTITSEIQKLAPSAVIELFELDLTDLGGDTFLFHAGTNGLSQNIIWDGNTYQRFPIEITGFEINGKGQLPRPRATLSKYLDVENFDGGVNPSADPTAAFPDDVFYIDRKLTEDRNIVEFELASPMDLAGVALPRRQIIQNICPWRYRGAECGYAGSSFFNSADQPVATLAQDVCGKRLSSCKKRFGQSGNLPFGGFPSCGLYR